MNSGKNQFSRDPIRSLVGSCYALPKGPRYEYLNSQQWLLQIKERHAAIAVQIAEYRTYKGRYPDN